MIIQLYTIRLILNKTTAKNTDTYEIIAANALGLIDCTFHVKYSFCKKIFNYNFFFLSFPISSSSINIVIS